MRKLMWFTIGFASACLLCALFWIDAWLWAAGLGCLAAFAGALFAGRRFRWLRRVAAVLLGLSVGFGWYHTFACVYLAPALALEGKTARITAVCTDYSYRTDYGTAVEGVVAENGKYYSLRLYVNGEAEMEPGDLVSGEFRFGVTAPGAAKASTYFQGTGTFLLAYQAGDAELGRVSDKPFWCMPAIWRQEILAVIDTFFSGDTAGFAKALLLGERSGISYEIDTAFKLSGISHIVAVSGLHVSILFGLVHTLGLRNRWLTALLGIPVLILFAAVAGFSPSITRACIMQILMLLSLCAEREYDPPTALAFSVFAMLLANPLAVLSVSFQLSIGCMAGIFLLRQSGFDKIKNRILKGILQGIATTVSAMVLTVPLSAWHFGAVSLVGVVTNLLTLWVVSLIFYGIMAVCALSYIWTAAAAVAAWVIAWPIRYVLGVAKLMAGFPLAAVYTESVYIVLWLALCYGLVLVYPFLRRKNPFTAVCCGVLGLALALLLSWTEPLLDGCRVTVLDVGQGQCVLLQSGGKAWMVDCGGSDDEAAADKAAAALLSQGVFRLDGIILTHYDRDHAGGIPYLLTRIPADVVFLPEIPDTDELRGPIMAQAEQTILVSADTNVDYDETHITIFGPTLTDSDNESGLCILFQAANCDILITGDRGEFGEWLLMQQYDLPRLEVLVAGHHGAASSTSEALLAATRPAVVAISVGENGYGHPAAQLLERLAAQGCAVYRTDEDGDIIFRR